MNERRGVPILYEDNHLLVVVKPPNLPSQRDASGDADLLTLLKAYVGEKYQKPGAVYLGLVHRLDRPVGGVMVVARTSKAAARLSEQVRERKLFKRYLAVVHGEVSRELALTDYLLKDERSGMVAVVPEGTPGAKLAQLVSTPLETVGIQDVPGAALWESAPHKSAGAQRAHDSVSPLTLLDIRMITGRAHQIRVQHTHAGYPLVGDQRYGIGASTGNPIDGGKPIALWAASLAFEHPTKRETMRFYAPPEMNGEWRKFEEIIATLAWEE